MDFLRQFHCLTVRCNIQWRDANRVGRDTQRPDNAVLVIALLDDRLQCPRDTDAIAAHDSGLAHTGLIQKGRAKLLTVFRTKLEHVADFNRPADFQRLAAIFAWFAGGNGSQIKPLRHLDVPLDGDVAEMETVFVCTSCHITRAP